ncbi:helix-turn-helix domain-containing protein [Mycobacterium szulgai]|uniref:helix-turn-helix domain-containing protein n=1 Tax=Mycobacterium szulgai TaxID=1787 RepID=UPI0021F3C477|nr:helix-turn-helix domain-containing protein [Mycobacterium szulgai]MCV7076469.1 helix-turn-helix domain-containing protein [Mycobacterium szulgai]
MISGTENTPAFARFLKDTREYFRFSQQSVADAGGPHRQLQAALEKGDEPEVSSAVLCMFDQAYGWPVGYTQAVAELGAYQQTFEQPQALAGDEHAELYWTISANRSTSLVLRQRHSPRCTGTPNATRG